MKKEELIRDVESAIRNFTKPGLEIAGDSEGVITVRENPDREMELYCREDSVELTFGLSGQCLEIRDYANPVALLADLIKMMTEILNEERVSIEYKYLFMKVNGLYPVTEIAKLMNRKRFRCISWNGTYNRNVP